MVNAVASCRPAASSNRTLTVASNTSAVPSTVTGLVTRSPMTGPVTTIAGNRSAYSARPAGASRPKATRRTVGNWVSV